MGYEKTLKDSQRKAMFAKAKYKKGDFVHYNGWGLGKVVGLKNIKDWNGNVGYIYRVSTKTFPKQHFQFGVKDVYDHEISGIIPNDKAKEMIEESKKNQKDRGFDY